MKSVLSTTTFLLQSIVFFQKKAAPKTEAATVLLHNIYLEKAYSLFIMKLTLVFKRLLEFVYCSHKENCLCLRFPNHIDEWLVEVQFYLFDG